MDDKEDLEKNKVIQENANAMLDSIKHSIVLLQIAKNTAHPINGIYQGPSTSNKIDAEETTGWLFCVIFDKRFLCFICGMFLYSHILCVEMDTDLPTTVCR